MRVIETSIDDVLILVPKVIGDHRGWFTESYSKLRLSGYNIDLEFIQDNHSYSSVKGTLRGLHFQINPKAQTKLVRCTRGAILDVAVDIRQGSPTYRKWVSVELSADNHQQLLIPKGFAHGFVTLTNDVEVQYKVDQYYDASCDRSIAYNDPTLDINWSVNNVILSEKDKVAPTLSESDVNFIYSEVNR